MIDHLASRIWKFGKSKNALKHFTLSIASRFFLSVRNNWLCNLFLVVKFFFPSPVPSRASTNFGKVDSSRKIRTTAEFSLSLHLVGQLSQTRSAITKLSSPDSLLLSPSLRPPRFNRNRVTVNILNSLPAKIRDRNTAVLTVHYTIRIRYNTGAEMLLCVSRRLIERALGSVARSINWH